MVTRPAIALFGPTSSGKTSLSLQIAEIVGMRDLVPVVLNADSRQIYRGMDIGTSKISEADMGGVDHRLIDIADPIRKYSLERYVQRARDILTELGDDQRNLPIVVGGTATYVTAIAQDWIVESNDAARRTMEAEFPRSEREEAHRMLRRLDPNRAGRIHPNNYEAIINALARLTSQTSHREMTTSPYQFLTFGLDRGVKETEDRLSATLNRQLADGLLEEIAILDDRLGLVAQSSQPVSRGTSVVLQTHGYREFVYRAASTSRSIRKLGASDIESAKWEALGHIIAYSRRQRSWIRKAGYSEPVSANHIVSKAFAGQG